MAAGTWIEAIGWALVHSLWQGSALAGGLALLLGALRRARPAVRYLLACLTLALMLLLPAATAVRVQRQLARDAAAGTASAARPPIEPRGDPGNSASTGPASPVVPALMPTLIPALIPTQVRVAAARAADAIASLDAGVREPLRGLLPALVLAWTIGAAVLLARLAGGWTLNRGLGHRDVYPVPDEWLAMLARLRRELRVRLPVRLVLSARVAAPSVVGWLWPVVLFPASALTGLAPWQVELLLRHELAHVRRYDYLVNLLQSVADALLFHHPAAWWVSRQIRMEREHCCDDVAAGAAGVPAYVRALVAMEELRPATAAGARPLAVGADGAPLLARVRRLAGLGHAPVAARRPAAPLAAMLVAMLAAVLVALLAAGALAASTGLRGPVGTADATPAGPPATAAGEAAVAVAAAAALRCDGADEGDGRDGRDSLTLCAPLTARVTALLAASCSDGAVVVQDVRTGTVVSYAAASRRGDLDVTTAVVPASVWKLTVAALWWEHGLGAATVPCPAELRVGEHVVRAAAGVSGPMDATGMLVQSCNTAAAAMALALRDRLGAEAMRADLRRLGFPVGGSEDEVAGERTGGGRDSTFWATTSAAWRARMSPAITTLRLPAADDDAAWAELAIGHPRVRVTPLHLSRLLQAIGNDGVMRRPTVERALAARGDSGMQVMQPATARRLREAMRRVVAEGTARGVAPLLADARWSLGGKTGTSQPAASDRVDGWFVGLMFDEREAPRYTVVVHLRGGGSGGGAPARLAAALTRELGGVAVPAAQAAVTATRTRQAPAAGSRPTARR